jgi:quercetin dioxygenase-like cupin family protein
VSARAFPDREGRPDDKPIARSDFAGELSRRRGDGWRVDAIYPADEPHTALLSRAGDRLRLTSQPEAAEPGTRLPDFRPEFLLTRAADDGGEGRAGMRYRDLIPGWLGGRYIASHITITDGGPVDDWVHFHAVAFQMIYVRSGWVRVVYEDQGAPFVMHAGDMVLQPPYIRHRVLESSAGLEVIEIGCPALHKTLGDHDMDLPNAADPDRLFAGQRFLWHRAAETPWTAFSDGEAQETGMQDATGGLAVVRSIRPAGSSTIGFDAHDCELVFGFVVAGSARLDGCGRHPLSPGDAFVIPPAEMWALAEASPDFKLLHVATARMPAEIPSAPAKSA